MNEAPTPQIENKLYFEHKIKLEYRNYIFKIDNKNSTLNFVINEENTISNDSYLNSFSLKQLQQMNNYFRMFDYINDVIMNLNKLFEDNKYKIIKGDKSINIEFFPGILIKGEIKFIMFLKEKTQNDKINDLSTITYSILKRLDLLEKENYDLKNKVKELTEALGEYKNQNKINKNDFFKDSVILTSNEDKEKNAKFHK